jgi:hypothetical protein
MYKQTFDLFSGSVDNQASWLESVRGLESALVRMRERAKYAPGHYFVYDSMTQTVMALIDTSETETSEPS